MEGGGGLGILYVHLEAVTSHRMSSLSQPPAAKRSGLDVLISTVRGLCTVTPHTAAVSQDQHDDIGS